MEKYEEIIRKCVYRVIDRPIDSQSDFADNLLIPTLESIYEDTDDLTGLEEVAQCNRISCSYFLPACEYAKKYSEYYWGIDTAIDAIREKYGDIQRDPGEVYAWWAMCTIMEICAQEIINDLEWGDADKEEGED